RIMSGSGGEMPVSDDNCGERGLLESDIESTAAAHAPADGADAVFLHVRLRGEIVERGVQVALGAVFGNSTHDLVSFIGRGGDLAAIEVDCERHISLIGQL